MKAYISFYKYLKRKIHLQGSDSQVHQHIEEKGQKGGSKHEDMLKDQQGGDVDPRFWSIFVQGNLINTYIFHPFSIKSILFSCILYILRYLILIFQFLEVFMKIVFQLQFWT